jgi:RHS repeat-associated protein
MLGEGRLSPLSCFLQKADGKRVKSVMQTNVEAVTTYFVGNHYEVTGTQVNKYYYAGAQRIALRKNDVLNFIMGDHLGSTSLVTDASGNVVNQTLYKAWGEERYSSGTQQTNYTFTGQYSYTADFGLMYYGARWMDPALGRFTQPDTLIPQQQGIQAWDRYAYSNNNPVRYTDPTGHWLESALDIAFIAYDIYDISTNGLNWENGLSLAADVAGLALPVVTGGGLAVRALMHADDAVDAVKVVNAIDNAVDTANAIDNVVDAGNAADNLTDVIKTADDIPCSFSAETDVSTLEGAKDIAAIEIGDHVLAWNEVDGTLGYYEVTAVMAHADETLTELIIDGEWIETTPEHPFYVEGKGWTPAEDLQIGDQIRQADGTMGLVWLKWTAYRTQEMYNLTVDTAHTFFVGEGQWLVHNTCPLASPGKNYTVAYETKLSPNSYPGKPREAHFYEANQNLLSDMGADPSFASGMDNLIPGIQRQISGPKAYGSPQNWTWHHSTEPGVMQLIPSADHWSKKFWSILHPGNRGGFSLWGKIPK